jgi:thiol-disulfide isomerase/thioredoxin
MVKNALAILVAMLVLLPGYAACKKRDPEPAPLVSATEAPAGVSPKPAGVEWFPGEVDAAFKHAQAKGKPVFLYWSAEWCPPCHELKATLFTRPEFQEKLKLFVPVYLDGDVAGAQKWAEVFQVVGYPTIVVLKNDRTELTRVLGGMDLARYNDVLDLALGEVQPVREMLASLERNAAPLSRNDCRRLAYNAWFAEDSIRESPAKATNALQRAVEHCPADALTERARLTVAAAFASSLADAHALRTGKAPSKATASLVKDVYGLLGDAQLSRGASDTFTWLGEEFFSAAKTDEKAAFKFLARWCRVMDAVSEDPKARDADRVLAIAFELRAVRALSADGNIPADIASRARQLVDSTLSKTHSEHARLSVVNGALLVLSTLDDLDRAFSILNHEIKSTSLAYYYMGGLGQLEEQRGNKDKAISWLERAYRESKGPATRFEWGTDYVLGLVRMRPDDAAGIREAALKVLSELDGPDRIYSRTASRLKRLDSTLREWNKQAVHESDIAALRTYMGGICGKIPDGDAARQKCNEFLAKA